MKAPLSGQNILLLGIGFYDYEAAIATGLRSFGAHVEVLDERPPVLRSNLAPLVRRSPTLTEALGVAHRQKMLAQIAAMEPLDEIIVIKCTTLDEYFLSELRHIQPSARLISYQWDSMKRYPQLVARQALFDRVFTFDHDDAQRYPHFTLRPNFYRPELTQTGLVPNTDLCFVGWLHHDRLAQVSALRTQARAIKLSYYFHLYTGTWTALRLRLAGAGEDVSRSQLTFSDYSRAAARARVLIDLPHPDQSGLTMRAMDAVGLGRKLITTAHDIRLYDFYRPENILIVDAVNPKIDPDFLAVPMAHVPEEVRSRYGVSAWIMDILGCGVPSGFLTDVAIPTLQEKEEK